VRTWGVGYQNEVGDAQIASARKAVWRVAGWGEGRPRSPSFLGNLSEPPPSPWKWVFGSDFAGLSRGSGTVEINDSTRTHWV
jgi:hypothetical protein